MSAGSMRSLVKRLLSSQSTCRTQTTHRALLRQQHERYSSSAVISSPRDVRQQIERWDSTTNVESAVTPPGTWLVSTAAWQCAEWAKETRQFGPVFMIYTKQLWDAKTPCLHILCTYQFY